MKASRRLAENDIITRGVTVKIQQVAVRRIIHIASSVVLQNAENVMSKLNIF
jgi:hypothetical protein